MSHLLPVAFGNAYLGRMKTKETQKLADLVAAASRITVLTGAGISTASGIPDFRSAGGIFADEHNVNVFDLSAFKRDPSIFYTFAREFFPKVIAAQPNAAHRALADWQRAGKEVTIVTQNVDDYHQRAGSDPIYAVHGTYLSSTCQACGAHRETAGLWPIIMAGEIPHCICGGVFKPDITFFGEMLPEFDWTESVWAMQRADLVLVLGTSLSVYPAGSLPRYRPAQAPLVIINREPTALDGEADLVIHADLCQIMGSVTPE